MKVFIVCSILALFQLPFSALANLPGGGNGTGANVTITDNGSTVTMANGIVSIVCTKSSAVLSQIFYTYNNSGSPVTYQMLSGGKDGGMFYWELGGFGTGNFTYTLAANPANNGGNYGEIDLLTTSTTNGAVDIHFSMLRGSTGFYVTAIWSHRAGDVAMGMGETRDNIYISPTFTWNSIDANRNFQYNIGASAVGVLGAPVECSLWTNGIGAWKYEDKYKYVADFGTERAWGWSSVNNPAAGFSGRNIGIWYALASVEYYNGGPMKPELMDAPMVNMLNGGHYQMGSDSQWGADEVWTRVSGPFFVYCNSVTNTLTNPYQTANALFADAQAQAVAEQSAWPYYWFTNANYAPTSNRGTIIGRFVISDTGNPNTSAADLYVGVVQQPITIDGVYDFQQWMKPYQFWVKSDTNGNFVIPNVIAGNNYTLYAFGPGAEGTFMSKAQTGGNPPNLFNLPTPTFTVTVVGGATNDLGTITWKPTRIGPTVFEIGYPDRTARKFRHGEDWWVGDLGPSPGNPSPIWSKFLEYPFDFPGGPNYVVGQSRWTTDWNFVQPCVTDNNGVYNGSTSTITFNLASAPANGSQASLYIATASDDAGPLEVFINTTNLGSASGVTATPSAIPSTGFFPSSSSSDTTIREGINAPFSDERLTFPGAMLHQGTNTIALNMRKGGSADNHAMYDYLRLELTGYVPPPPGNVSAYPGNNCNLICWPVTPGAVTYNLLTSTTSGSNYSLLANGIVGPVCGSGSSNAIYLDTNAINGTPYYYVVQTVNAAGVSTNSPQSSVTIPSNALSTNPPPTPTGLAIASVAHASIKLTWNASAGANYYTVQRSTLVNTDGGASNSLRTITLDNAVTGTIYSDTSPTDGSIYSYSVSAASAGGTSGNSTPIVGVALPLPPASGPGSLKGSFSQTTNINLTWSAVPGAVGYVLRRATSASGPFTYVMSITETSYNDVGLNANSTYYYQVAAMNAAGVSSNSLITVSGAPTAPASLSAIAGNSQILLIWPAVTSATSYTIKRGTAPGSEPTTVITSYTGTTYTNTGLANGTTYYYIVTATGAGGTSSNSPEASATPSSAASSSLVWTGSAGTNWDVVSLNWLNGANTTVYTDGNNVTFDNTGVTGIVSIASAVFPGAVTFANSSLNYTLSGAGGISGTASITKTNSGTVSFTTANSYSGGLIVSGGLATLPGANGSTAFTSAVGSGTVTINNGGELQLAPPGGSAGRTSSTFTNNFVLNGGILYANDGQEHLTGAINVNADTTLIRQWNNSSSDQLKALLLDGSISGSGALNLYGTGGSANQGARIWIDNASNTYAGIVTVYPGTAFPGFSAAAGGFSLGIGANNALQFATVNLLGTQPSSATDATETYGLQFLGGVTKPFLGALAGNGKINLDTFVTVTAVALTVGGNDADTVFSGILSSTTGNGSLTKIGMGTMSLSGANTYTGGTVVNAGTLLVNNTTGSGVGTGPVAVNDGGALGGTGFISGPTAINDNATFVPGNPLGALAINNTLSLSTYSFTAMTISSASLTNSQAKITGAMTQAGTLTVTNIATNTLVAGAHFILFNAGSYLGAFDDVELANLDAGLAWDTSRLNVDGSLWVISTVPPNLGADIIGTVSGNSLVLNGTGGTPNWYYYVLSSPDPTLPPSQWTRIATNQFDSNGNFSFTNAINPNVSQTFLMLGIP